jgi:trehalose 6-phosphate phosphatase
MIAANDNLQAALDLLAAPDCALFLDFDGTLVDIARCAACR